MKILFIDESGDHNLDPKKVDESYPIFVLAGCIFDQEYYEKIVVPSFKILNPIFFPVGDGHKSIDEFDKGISIFIYKIIIRVSITSFLFFIVKLIHPSPALSFM